MEETIDEEGSAIVETLRANLPRFLDGKEAILLLQTVDYNWRQMEWIGWYVEYAGREALVESIGGSVGPRVGSRTSASRRTSGPPGSVMTMARMGGDYIWERTSDRAGRGTVGQADGRTDGGYAGQRQTQN